MTGTRRNPLSWLAALAARGLALPAAFLTVVLPLGVLLAALTPPGLVADEPAHVIRAEAILHGSLIGLRRTTTDASGHTVTEAGVVGDRALLLANFFPGEQVTAAAWNAKRAAIWDGRAGFMEMSPIAIYLPVFYLPASLGIAAAKHAGATPFQAIHVARFAMLAVYAALGLAALICAGRGRGLIFLTLSLPMTLSLGASCNPDGLLIATSALAAALAGAGRWRAAAVCLALVILVKPPYAPLALILLTPLRPWAGWPSLRARLAAVMLVTLPSVLWFAYAQARIAAPRPFAPYHPGPLWPGNPSDLFVAADGVAQLRVIAAQPLGYLRMLWHSAAGNPNLRSEIIGVLGSLDFPLTPTLYRLWWIAAAAALLAGLLGRHDRKAAGPIDAAIIALGLAACVVLVWTSQYLTWDQVGAADIIGPSGRYLLPLIPAIGLALPAIRLPGSNRLRAALLCLPIAAAALTLALLPPILAVHFYLGGH